mgnify:CR=1 FL=1
MSGSPIITGVIGVSDPENVARELDDRVLEPPSRPDEWDTALAGVAIGLAIVALLVDDPSVFSDMHRLPTDEIWHFYLGDPIQLLLLHPDGSDELVILGQDVLAGQRVQTVVPAGAYMGARLQPGGEFGVYGNTMAPGFVLTDFEAGTAEESLGLAHRWRDSVIAALGSPAIAIIMLLFILTSIYHMMLGMQTIIEDYVHSEGTKTFSLALNIFFSFAVGLACVYAVLRLSFV